MKLATRTFRKDRGTGPDQYYITSPFGWRHDPKTGEWKGHNGCDYGTHGQKWPQYALEDGVVENVYQDDYGANCVRIAYPRIGIRLTYAHLDRICVQKGQSVNKDTILGYTGTTGYSTGIHLHLGVQAIGDWKWIDPETIDYQEGPSPTPPDPGKFPFNAIIKKGSPLFNGDGVQYKYGAQRDRNVVVKGEYNGRYLIRCEYFNPKEVYCNKDSIKDITPNPYPFNAVIKKGSVLYTKDGRRYKNKTFYDRAVIVQGEYNGRYEIYGKTFNPNIVYCDKSSIK